MTTENCVVCNSETYSSGSTGDSQNFNCHRCGQYEISGSARAILRHQVPVGDRRRIQLSHQIRLKHDPARWMTLNTENLTRLMEVPLPSVGQQAVNVMLWLGARADYEAEVSVPIVELEAVVGAPRPEASKYVTTH